VVDDLDMGITHVIRGDDHVNNTPRQVNILKALGAPLPQYAHVPMILGADGERLSKRHGAVSVMQYRDEGYLPEALANYLARLGWSHGDAEIFSLAQFIDWFDLKHISKSPAQFNPEKLQWLNQQHLKQLDDESLAQMAAPLLEARGFDLTRGPSVAGVVQLLKERVGTLIQLADEAVYFYQPVDPPAELKKEHYAADIKPALDELMRSFAKIQWQRPAIHDALKAVVSQHGLKLPQIAMPLRVMVTGGTQTPGIDATLELIGKEEVLRRMQRQMSSYHA